MTPSDSDRSTNTDRYGAAVGSVLYGPGQGDANVQVVSVGPASSAGRPELELGLTEISECAGVPYPSMHPEIERAEAEGLVTSRKIGRTRVVRSNVESPYFASLADLLNRAFGPPSVLSAALIDVGGIHQAFLFGPWAANYQGEATDRPVGDIDLLVLGEPDRDDLYAAVSKVEVQLGREVQVTIRPTDWLDSGSGAFHANVTARPIVELELLGHVKA